jgi:hypothetical protein
MVTQKVQAPANIYWGLYHYQQTLCRIHRYINRINNVMFNKYRDCNTKCNVLQSFNYQNYQNIQQQMWIVIYNCKLDFGSFIRLILPP